MVKYKKIPLPYGGYLSKKDYNICVEICKVNGVKPTKKNILAAHMSFHC